MCKKKIGIICNWQPFPVKSGSNRRLSEIILFLRRNNYFVHLIVVGAKYKQKELKKHVDSIHFFIDPRIRFYLKLKSIYLLINDWITKFGLPHIDDIFLSLFGRLKKKSSFKIDYATMCPPGLSEFVADIADSHHWDAIIVEYIWLYQSINKLPQKIVKFVDTHDVMHIRSMKIEKTGYRFSFKITEFEEAKILNHFNCVIAIQETERAKFHEIRKKYNMAFDVIKVGTSINTSNNSKNFIPQANKLTNTILFVGGYNELNIVGLRHFLSIAWKKLHDQYPSVQLVVCGTVCSAFHNIKYPGVNFIGYVADLEKIYNNALIVVNPIWIGTGLKIKTIEAIAFGKPLVTTPIGIEGMDNEIFDACAVAENEDAFIEKLIFLIDHPFEREKLSIKASEFYNEHLTFESTYNEFKNYLKKWL